MPLRNYGLLTGKVTGFGPQGGGNPYHRIAINLGRSIPGVKSDLEYQIVPDLERAGSAGKALLLQDTFGFTESTMFSRQPCGSNFGVSATTGKRQIGALLTCPTVF
jgi:hypothetical protein